MNIVLEEALPMPRITVCGTTYVRCDCSLWYRHDAFEPFRCTINTTDEMASDSMLTLAAPCGHSHPRGVAAAEAEILSYVANVANIPEPMLLRFASHQFVTASTTGDADAPHLHVHGLGSIDLLSRNVLLTCTHEGVDCASSESWDMFLDYRHGVCATYSPSTIAGSELRARTHAFSCD